MGKPVDHSFRSLWGMRMFRLQVYAALLLTAVTMPISYFVFDAVNTQPVVAAASKSVANVVKSTAFYIADDPR